MQKKGKWWPTDNDKQPTVSVFHVPRSTLTSPQAEYIPGQQGITITETHAHVEERLKDTFPLYRIAAYGRKILNITQGTKK